MNLGQKIRAVLTDDLLHPKYRGNPKAHCYVASEAFYHLSGGKESGLVPMQIRHEGSSHWYLRSPEGGYIDLTRDQFKTPVPYAEGSIRGFLTKLPSKRAQIVMERVRG